jgi:hypothetical protein
MGSRLDHLPPLDRSSHWQGKQRELLQVLEAWSEESKAAMHNQ